MYSGGSCDGLEWIDTTGLGSVGGEPDLWCRGGVFDDPDKEVGGEPDEMKKGGQIGRPFVVLISRELRSVVEDVVLRALGPTVFDHCVVNVGCCCPAGSSHFANFLPAFDAGANLESRFAFEVSVDGLYAPAVIDFDVIAQPAVVGHFLHRAVGC